MAREVISARGGDGLQLMVRQQPAEMPPRRRQRVEEHIVRIIHLVHPENRLQASFVKTRVMRDQRQPGDGRRDAFPHVWEHRRGLSVLRTQAVHPPAEPRIVLRLRMDQAVQPLLHTPVPHNDYPDAAHARRPLIRRLEIYCRKVPHASRKDTNSTKQSEQPVWTAPRRDLKCLIDPILMV